MTKKIRRKLTELDYLEEFKKLYDPYNFLSISSYRKIQELGQKMLNDGYNLDQVYNANDTARALYKYPKVIRTKTKVKGS